MHRQSNTHLLNALIMSPDSIIASANYRMCSRGPFKNWSGETITPRSRGPSPAPKTQLKPASSRVGKQLTPLVLRRQQRVGGPGKENSSHLHVCMRQLWARLVSKAAHCGPVLTSALSEARSRRAALTHTTTTCL